MGFYTTNLANEILDAIFNNTSLAYAAPAISLHTDHPGTAATSTDEVTGGSYARQAISCGLASAAAIANDAAVTFAGMPAATVMFFGLYDAVAGNYRGFGPLGAAKRVVFDALNTGDVFNSQAHGLVNDDRVYLEAGVGGALPTGPVVGTVYHVVGVTTNTFQISATQGGGAVALTSDGTGRAIRTIPKVVAATDTLEFAIGDLDFALPVA
jgi:hypothetical protein